MQLFTTQLIGLCLRVIPIVILLGSVLGLLGLFNVGPRELPKDHRLNRYLSITTFTIGVGMFFISVPGVASYLGLGLSILGLLAYTYILREVRQEFPQISPEEWLSKVRKRYKFASEEEPSQKDKAPKK